MYFPFQKYDRNCYLMPAKDGMIQNQDFWLSHDFPDSIKNLFKTVIRTDSKHRDARSQRKKKIFFVSTLSNQILLFSFAKLRFDLNLL